MCALLVEPRLNVFKTVKMLIAVFWIAKIKTRNSYKDKATIAMLITYDNISSYEANLTTDVWAGIFIVSSYEFKRNCLLHQGPPIYILMLELPRLLEDVPLII